MGGVMDINEILMHYRAGADCDIVNLSSASGISAISSTGQRAAQAMTGKGNGKTFEAYPCVWCAGVHIGRAMTEDEKTQFWADHSE
jgi:hypothetical protein